MSRAPSMGQPHGHEEGGILGTGTLGCAEKSGAVATGHFTETTKWRSFSTS